MMLILGFVHNILNLSHNIPDVFYDILDVPHIIPFTDVIIYNMTYSVFFEESKNYGHYSLLRV